MVPAPVPAAIAARAAVAIGASAAACTLALVAAGVHAQPQSDANPDARGSATRPASRPSPVDFQPGVRIDWARREVLVAGRVVLAAGPLEFVACFRGKEHESIVRMDAAPVHLYAALGLIGLTPGSPPTWDGRGVRSGPRGDAVDVWFEWAEEGAARRVRAFDWVREIEYERTPRARPWVFAGSFARSDGSLAAEASGAGVALVDAPDALLSLTRRYSSADDELWAEVDARGVPATGTPVRTVFVAAAWSPPAVSIDGRGAARVEGRYERDEDVVDWLRLVQEASGVGAAAGAGGGAAAVVIRLEGTLRADERRWRALLADAGVRAELTRD